MQSICRNDGRYITNIHTIPSVYYIDFRDSLAQSPQPNGKGIIQNVTCRIKKEIHIVLCQSSPPPKKN